ncbi:hypothetical protein BP6252_10767 [Coleophoma cylindrospora]|uniref:Arginase n=1 Tax=Coleophoma cylindrospora TaxID=1849047 RepID=A0A3D8QTF3_9HELO|nr:hypothetical protein BP6252_10767 [Coleophoma cylindrospora]
MHPRMVVSALITVLPISIAISGPEHLTHIYELQSKWGADYNFGGIATFAHLRHVDCLVEKSRKFDVGIIGIPFEAAAGWCAGVRSGPHAIRDASSRQNAFRGFNHRAGFNPYRSWARINDCGDVQQEPGADQLSQAFSELSSRKAATAKELRKPIIIAIGGDGASTLPALRSLKALYHRPIAVVSLGAIIDDTGSGDLSDSNSSIYAGYQRISTRERNTIRVRDAAFYDGVCSDDIDSLGPEGVASIINSRVGTMMPVYLRINLNVIDVGLAPGVCEPHVGGWTSREVIRILRAIEGLNVIGAEIIGIAPSHDGDGQQTALAAAQFGYEILTSIVKRGATERTM